jgi:hypothetical protein
LGISCSGGAVVGGPGPGTPGDICLRYAVRPLGDAPGDWMCDKSPVPGCQAKAAA